MARFGLPTVLGASAAGAYGMQQYSQSGMSGVWSMLPGAWTPGSSGGSSEVSALQNELRRLTGMVGDMARNNQRPTVVTVGGGRGGWTVLIVPVVVGGTVIYIYCRVTGTSVWDMFYVSRSSLSAFRTTVQEGMTRMWDEMKKQKEEIFKVVTSLGRKQDEMKENQAELMAKQDQMDERLRRVDDTCYQLDSKANTTIHRVEQMDNRLQDVHTGVQAANQGIYMLVSAVSEVTQKIGLHNSRTAQALHRLASHGPSWQTSTSSTSLPAPVTPEALPAPNATPLAQLPAPATGSATMPVTAAALGGTGGVATPGGLRGLMGGRAATAPVATIPKLAEVVDMNGDLTGCKIEEVKENGSVVEPVVVAKAKPAGLSLLGF